MKSIKDLLAEMGGPLWPNGIKKEAKRGDPRFTTAFAFLDLATYAERLKALLEEK